MASLKIAGDKFFDVRTGIVDGFDSRLTRDSLSEILMEVNPIELLVS